MTFAKCVLERSLKLPVVRVSSFRTSDNDYLKSERFFSSRLGSEQNGLERLPETAANAVADNCLADLFIDNDADTHTILARRPPAQTQELGVSGPAAAQTLKGAVTL